MEVTSSWSMEANSGARGRVRAAQKALRGMTDTQSDTHTRSIHYMMMVVVLSSIEALVYVFYTV